MGTAPSKKKVVLITGCSSGFGKITAMTLARQGHQVYASMRDSKHRNHKVFLELQEVGENLIPIDLDVTLNSSVNTAVKTVIEAEGKIDVLVNNAGVMNVGVTEAFTLEQIQKQFDVNVFGSIRTAKAVLPHMREQRSGLLIQISSLAGRAVFPFFGVYCASKYAVETLAESLRYELKSFCIDSVIIEPGPFETDLISRNTPRPGDKAVVQEYGDVAKIPESILAAFVEGYKAKDAPRPQLVADAVSALIAMQQGERPMRTIVTGEDFGLRNFNDVALPYQRGVLKAFGM